MTGVTQILEQIESGDPAAAEQLLPLVYDELRHLTAAKVCREDGNPSLDATALVHEAFLRLVESCNQPSWDSRGGKMTVIGPMRVRGCSID